MWSEMLPVSITCFTVNHGFEDSSFPIVSGWMWLSHSYTWKPLFYFHYDIVIVLKGLNINVCEELDTQECEAKSCAGAGLSWFHIEIERCFLTKWPLMLPACCRLGQIAILSGLSSGMGVHIGLCHWSWAANSWRCEDAQRAEPVLHPCGNAWRSVGPPGESFPAYGEVSLASFSAVGTKNTSGVDFPVQREFSCSSTGHLYVDITASVSLQNHDFWTDFFWFCCQKGCMRTRV